MQQPSCAYACARISALENGLLDRRAVKRMADGSLEDAMRVLLDARYGNLPDATASDCERMIENVRAEAAREIRAISPKPELTDLFLLETDVHNLKLLIKARLLEQAEVPLLLGGLYEPEQL
ncbi:MAG TPA: V-type ATPase subunit, partial [Candidatus Aphodomorpha intestinavium]|nr:V-type ATPase subunit [Candidatus Aphodomorpha intestinavium]